MEEKKLYLRSNVVIEPLVDRWYAWSHLISPATTALNIMERHLTIMESFVMAPDVHAQAVLNPKMKGGPFMDIPVARAAEVEGLFNKTIAGQEQVLAFAKAIKSLDKILLTEAKGFGMEGLYERVPELLKGYVELFHDRNNNADFRFFESLLYKSPFYNKGSQSVALWITDNDHRPFCLSTPRLDADDVLHLDIPFDSTIIDDLARMKRVPDSTGKLKKALGLDRERAVLFDELFTTAPPVSYQKYTGDKIRMRYFGHACILIETKDISVLVDPLISYYGYQSEVDRFTFEDLPEIIDYVLITHNHQDHILFETLLPLRHKIKNIIVPRAGSGRLEDPDLKLMFEELGFANVISVNEMETVRFESAEIIGLPFIGEHSDLNIMTKSCYLMKIGEFKLLFLADSRIVESRLYKHVAGIVGDVDVMFLGMECDGAPLSWLYGPLMTRKLTRDQDGSRRLAGSDCAKGMSLVDIFHPKEVYVYAMGQEPWIEFISSVKYTDESNPIVQSDQLVARCNARNIIAQRLYGEKELLYNKKYQLACEII